MKCYTTTEALWDRIKQMETLREQQDWSKEDEQIYAFLIELHTLRITFMHTYNEFKGIAETISNLHDELQDEKGMLVY